MASRPSEYIRFIDGGNAPVLTTSWTLTSPNATVWAPTISTGGIVTFTDGAVAATTPVFIGMDGLAWSPTIDNDGIVTATSGSALSSTDTAASIMDADSVVWTFYVDADGLVNITTSAVIPTLFRYPSTVMSWTPTANTDQLIVYSVRVAMTVRRKTS